MTTERHNTGIDEHTWELLMQRFDALDKKVDDGFKTMNGRVRTTEKMVYMAFGGITLIGFAIPIIVKMMQT